jgi:MerR family transcriptional regulator, thiopeptide resistance regulator
LPTSSRSWIRKQIEAIAEQSQKLADTRALLEHTLSRIDHGEPVDAATFCSLIQAGKNIMEDENWKIVINDYFSPNEQKQFAAKMAEVGEGFNQAAYGEKWRHLGCRIEAALPIDPQSEAAQSFVDEWFALLKPFSEVATPEMWNGTARMYDGMADWRATPDMGFGTGVWDFIKAATKARLDAGGRIDGPIWMKGE